MNPFHWRCRLVLFALVLSQSCQAFTSRALSGRPAASYSLRVVRLATKSSSHNDEILDQYFVQQIAKDVTNNLDVPFMIPSPVVTYLAEQAVARLSADLSQQTKVQLQELLQAAASPSTDDNFVEQDLNQIADQIAKEINPKIDVPVLDENQEYILLQQIMRLVLQSMSRGENVQWVDTNLLVSRELLGGPESRLQLARSIDKKIEIPLPLGESQRLAIITKAVESCADFLTKLLPPALLESLKGESPEGLLKMKEYLIDTVNAKVDLVGVNEVQERQLIETMVNLLIDEYVDDTDAEFFLFTQQEQQVRLQEKKEALELEKTFSQRRFEREQASLDSKLQRIEDRLKEIQRK